MTDLCAPTIQRGASGSGESARSPPGPGPQITQLLPAAKNVRNGWFAVALTSRPEAMRSGKLL